MKIKKLTSKELNEALNPVVFDPLNKEYIKKSFLIEASAEERLAKAQSRAQDVKDRLRSLGVYDIPGIQGIMTLEQLGIEPFKFTFVLQDATDVQGEFKLPKPELFKDTLARINTQLTNDSSLVLDVKKEGSEDVFTISFKMSDLETKLPGSKKNIRAITVDSSDGKGKFYNVEISRNLSKVVGQETEKTETEEKTKCEDLKINDEITYEKKNYIVVNVNNQNVVEGEVEVKLKGDKSEATIKVKCEEVVKVGSAEGGEGTEGGEKEDKKKVNKEKMMSDLTSFFQFIVNNKKILSTGTSKPSPTTTDKGGINTTITDRGQKQESVFDEIEKLLLEVDGNPDEGTTEIPTTKTGGQPITAKILTKSIELGPKAKVRRDGDIYNYGVATGKIPATGNFDFKKWDGTLKALPKEGANVVVTLTAKDPNKFDTEQKKAFDVVKNLVGQNAKIRISKKDTNGTMFVIEFGTKAFIGQTSGLNVNLKQPNVVINVGPKFGGEEIFKENFPATIQIAPVTQ